MEGSLARQFQRGLRHLRLSAIGAAGDQRDAPPVELAALEIHARIGSGGILPQQRIEGDQRLDQKFPVGVGDGAQALDVLDQRRSGPLLLGAQQRQRFVQQPFHAAQI